MNNEITNTNNNGLVNQENSANEIRNKKEIAQQILNRKISFLDRIAPSKEIRETMKYKADVLMQEAKSDLETRRMHNEFFRQGLAETFNKILIEGKKEIRGKLTRDGVKMKAQLDEIVNEISILYYDKMEKLEESIMQTKSENMRNRKLQMLEDRLNEFDMTVKILMQKYQDINNEGVDKIGY
ncbi:conserved protein of unknown function [Tenacibaculum sp. 190524A02b]|uniref:Uncharacterized protein n=1 Tax=Tenacibaculum vairaonense TaxID=3137860 RepID=A0ABP1F8F6_9FLAO